MSGESYPDQTGHLPELVWKTTAAPTTYIYPPLPPTTGPIAHWKFDETSGTTASDASANNLIGPLRHGHSWTTGRLGNALAFDGTDSYVDAGNVVGAFDFERTDPFSLSSWIKATKTGFGSIIAKQAPMISNMRGYHLYKDDSNRLGFNLNYSATHAIEVRGNPSKLNDGSWHHVAVTYDGSSTAAGVKLYVDGLLQTNDVLSDVRGNHSLSGTIKDTTPFLIGNRGENDLLFQGTIDDVRVYNRVLSTSEVQTLATGSAYAEALSSSLYLTPSSASPTPVIDTTPPTISNVQFVSLSANAAVITWTTDAPSTMQVDYGLTTAYEAFTPENTALRNSHTQLLTGLSPNTLYHYRVKSKDATGNLAISGDLTLRTSFGTQEEANVFLGPHHWLETTSAAMLTQAIRRTNQFTVSATVATADTAQSGPARIISLSGDPYRRNFTLGQEGTHLVFRLRTPLTGANGTKPELLVPDIFVDTNRHHLAITYDGSVLVLYVDGVQHPRALKLTPGATLASYVFPDRIEGPINTIQYYEQITLYYGLAFIPVGVFLGLIVTLLRQRCILRMLLIGGGILIPPLALEEILVSVSGKTTSLENLALGIGITVGTTLLFKMRTVSGGENMNKAMLNRATRYEHTEPLL